MATTPRNIRLLEDSEADYAQAVNDAIFDIEREINEVENAVANNSYEVQFYYPGLIAAGHDVVWRVASKAYTFPANLSGSRAAAKIAATSVATFSIRKNGVQFATLTFAAGALVGTFTGTATTINVGDIVTVVSPDPADTTLSHLAFTLLGTLVS